MINPAWCLSVGVGIVVQSLQQYCDLVDPCPPQPEESQARQQMDNPFLTLPSQMLAVRGDAVLSDDTRCQGC